MRQATIVAFGLLLQICSGFSQATPTARSVNDQLSEISVDPTQVYRVRDLKLQRGGVKLYLNEGVLAFAKPVDGRVVAAVFTTQGVEAGDAEVIALPPNRSERTSLAAFTKSPNLNEHFSSAIFFFFDRTSEECLQQMPDAPGHLAPELAPAVGTNFNSVLRNLYPSFNLSIVKAIIDGSTGSKDGAFYGTFGARDLGIFNFLYEPLSPEPVVFGHIDPKTDVFQLWTSYRDKSSEMLPPPRSRFSQYRIEASISDKLRLSAQASFQYQSDDRDGRSLRFELSEHLQVTSAAIDGAAVEVFERKTLDRESGAFLLVPPEPIRPGPHRIAVSYEGEVIQHAEGQSYFVRDRNTWYPRGSNTYTEYDLTFHCPSSLTLVSTGDPISDSVKDGIRTVHRKTAVPQNVAAFNLGEYSVSSISADPYKVEVFANRVAELDVDLGNKTAEILQTYSRWWIPLPYRTLAVSPIAGYFGQGFPGLIYLSDVSYIRERSRPQKLRTTRMDSFFSGQLLPHEVAHQWWGNLVVADTYRAGWLSEAMATHSALEYIAERSGEQARYDLLEQYKSDLQLRHEGNTIESLGPVDFGVRLIDAISKEAWQVIVYEKGAWILRMLQARLGDRNWRDLQIDMLKTFAAQPVTNDAFRQLAARHLPPGQPDPALELFFETWVYSTGLPKLVLQKAGGGWELEMSGVDEDFSTDVPLFCNGKIQWVRATTGATPVPHVPRGQSCALPSPNSFLYVR